LDIGLLDKQLTGKNLELNSE